MNENRPAVFEHREERKLRMKQMEAYTCTKCGKMIIRFTGGIVLSPEEAAFQMRPLCRICQVVELRGRLQRGVELLKQ